MIEIDGKKTLKSIVDELLKTLKNAYAEQASDEDAYQTVTPKLNFVTSGDAIISVDPYWGKLTNKKEGEESSLLLKDGTSIDGITADSSIAMGVDGIDFRHTVIRRKKRAFQPLQRLTIPGY